MKRIKIVLARDHQFPNGSSERGYEFAAPLDDAGHIVRDEWRQQRERCRVIRFWPGAKNEVGLLVHRGGGWAFDYDPKSTDDDEPGFKFDCHRFVPGEYVSIKERDGELRTFRIVMVRDLDD
ncbi:MAG TPA: hypothetical protein VFY92_08835 [Hyphomicrobiaceae bacterium]|nr:hypothetical protein [Hyphomicrobiaceae bacterium]